VVSVVIPAHNEAQVIGTCLDSILEGAAGDLDVIVVCNGCEDATAAIAGSRPGVRVIETPVGSKPHALNLGDEAAGSSFPRLYLDADVLFTASAVRSIADALTGEVVAASPSLALDDSRSGWIVRSYHRIWRELPIIRHGLVGRGAYAMTEAGRGRFERFPDLIADDLFVHRLFAPHEKAVVESVSSVVSTPKTVGDLVARKARSTRGIDELTAAIPEAADRARSNTAWLGVVRRDPRRILDVPAYLLVTVLVRLAARRQRRRGAGWGRDESSRER